MAEQTYQRLWDAACHRIYDWVTPGDTIRTGDRTMWLTVNGFYEHTDLKTYSPDYFDTVELSGNDTRHHLLCWDEEGDTGPMLYKESEWEQVEDGPNEYEYPRGGERVEEIEIGVRYAHSPMTDSFYWVSDWEEPNGDERIVVKTKEQVERSYVPDGWLELLEVADA